MNEILLLILSYLLPILVPLLAALVMWALGLLLKKLNIDIEIRNNTIIRSSVRRAIAATEEWAARQLKYDASKGPDSVAKLTKAKGLLSTQWPKLLPEELDRLIDEELAVLCGPGATGDTQVIE